MKHLDIVISGKVQRVSFRVSTKAVADLLGIKGIIKNMPDGTVYAEAEGSAYAIESFLDWCKEGPEHAVVENVIQSESELKNYRNFEVLKK
ncbi:acylphosphatase [Albibacterium bauzanense]|uniref:acylphosphatase n=1 Tax=Albibacterium bauzanense TaxID=653929 RepID=A0A4R1LWY2_9SPHI|nr:acylphosphatase [Albibacterium bauzanense]TCK83050.1 acylphosphatase [Albibacterium bauzanense]